MGHNHICYLKGSVQQQSGTWTGQGRTSSPRIGPENVMEGEGSMCPGCTSSLLPFQFFEWL